MELNLNLGQHQTLSLKQALSVTILQLGQCELQELLEKEMLENPVIEPYISQYSPPPLEVQPYYLNGANRSAAVVDFLNDINSEEDCESLADHIFSQIKLSNLSQGEKINAAAICGFVEKSGYILSDVDTLCSKTGLQRAEAQAAIAFIQTLEPVGVGARCLSECLCLQLSEDDLLSKRLATDFLPQIANGKLAAIAHQLKISLDAVEGSVTIIKSLNPKPGLLYGKQAQPIFAVPDIILTVQNSKTEVFLSKESTVSFKLSNSYLELLKTCTDKATIKYLNEKLEKAKWLQQCVENRGKTLLSVATAIAVRQEAFLTSASGELKPLRLADIATDTSLHESTVSRAVKDKYIQCPHGILALKQLFSGGTHPQTAQGDVGVSTHAIKGKIKDIIGSEPHLHPLSDQKISDLLKSEGITCSRRTVAKYREEMEIASTNSR